MESSIYYQPGTIRTESNVLQPHQLPSHFPNHDERHLRPRTQGRVDHNIHGRHPGLHEPKQRET